jgi:hypothetical protein
MKNNFKDFQNFISKLLKEGYNMLPGISEPKKLEKDNYVYKEKFLLEEKFSISIGQYPENISIYGYIIEFKISRFWHIYYSKKFYKTKESAIDALNQLNKCKCIDQEFRLVPLFTMNNIQWRDYTISQIIKN